MPPSIVQGSIVWATIADSHGGNPKSRPTVVLTPNSRIDPQGEVELAAITSLVGSARFEETVELPSHPDGHALTGLKKPSEVVCTWLASVRLARCDGYSSSRFSRRSRRSIDSTVPVDDTEYSRRA